MVSFLGATERLEITHKGENMKRIIRALLALSIVSTIGFGVPSVSAAEGESIAMTPTSKRYSLDPGVSEKDSLNVINDGTQEYTVRIYTRPYSVQGEDYQPVFSKLTPVTDAYEWISLETTEFTIKPGKTVTVPYTITVPENADAGGHYGVIFAETQPKAGEPGSVVRKKRVGAIVYATVKGDNRSEGNVLSTNIPFLQTEAPLRAFSRVGNSGNVDFLDKTSVKVTTIFGADKYHNERELAVLPSTTRKIDYDWKNGSMFGLYNVTISHTILGKTSTTTGTVLLIPVWLMIMLGVVVSTSAVYLIARPKLKNQTKTKRRATKKISKK